MGKTGSFWPVRTSQDSPRPLLEGAGRGRREDSAAGGGWAR